MHKKKIFLVRHGETDWSLSGQHTGKTDIPLTEKGKEEALRLAPILQKIQITKALISPLKRAHETFNLAGLNVPRELDKDLEEWDYGDYEGLSSKEIAETNPDWSIFINGAPGGESLQDIENRTARVLDKIQSIDGNVALFSSGHILRALAARWLNLPLSFGRQLTLSTGSISILGYEHNLPSLLLWNGERPL